MAKVIAICNHKGGVAKTATTASLGFGLARAGKKVLLVDSDHQGSLTISLGWGLYEPLKITIKDKYMDVIEDRPLTKDGILTHEEGVDLLPSNLDFSSIAIPLINAYDRERVLKTYIDTIRDDYDYILIDCKPDLDLIVVNALVAADSVIIPVDATFLGACGMTQLFHTLAGVKKKLNRGLVFEGILMTMVNKRTNICKEMCEQVKENWNDICPVFDVQIPRQTYAAEVAAMGISIYKYKPRSTVAKAYEKFTQEVLKHG